MPNVAAAIAPNVRRVAVTFSAVAQVRCIPRSRSHTSAVPQYHRIDRENDSIWNFKILKAGCFKNFKTQMRCSTRPMRHECGFGYASSIRAALLRRGWSNKIVIRRGAVRLGQTARCRKSSIRRTDT